MRISIRYRTILTLITRIARSTVILLLLLFAIINGTLTRKKDTYVGGLGSGSRFGALGESGLVLRV